MDMQIELSSHQKDLIDSKNVLNSSVIEKYRLAGQIAQSALVYVSSLVESQFEEKSIGEICRSGDEFLKNAIENVYKKTVEEKGIALPVQIEKEHFISSVAPEEGDIFQGGHLGDGDIAKVTLGVHIDGYTALVSHTLVCREFSDQQRLNPENLQPYQGVQADAVCAAYIATEAVLALIGQVLYPDLIASGPVTGTRIKQLVDSIAKAFRVKVVPGSRVRKIRRFLAGQNDIIDEVDFKGLVWEQEAGEKLAQSLASNNGLELSQDLATDSVEDFVVVEGEVWIVDIKMAATGGKPGVLAIREFTGYSGTGEAKPSVYSRDFSIHYGLKLNSARNILSKVSSTTSVYPFKLSYLASDQSELNSVRLGVTEIINHHMIVPHPIETVDLVSLDIYINGAPSSKAIKNASVAVPVAREMTTVILLPASISSSGYGEVIRLTGGNKVAPPTWVHSAYEIVDEDIKQLLALLNDKKFGIRVRQVQPLRGVLKQLEQVEGEDMEIE